MTSEEAKRKREAYSGPEPDSWAAYYGGELVPFMPPSLDEHVKFSVADYLEQLGNAYIERAKILRAEAENFSPRLVDAFPFAGSDTELLLLECRLSTLYDCVDAFIIVEATTDHQGHPKDIHYLEHEDQFAPWKDKITLVVADDLPTVEEDDWSWAREHAQREHINRGLAEFDAQPNDLVMQSDADEIPNPLVVRNLKLQGSQLCSFEQKGHFWAIDWLYPHPWYGTTATRVENLSRLAQGDAGPFTMMRNMRNLSTLKLPNGGWHWSWLGRAAAAKRKVGSFCHPEVEKQMRMDDLDWYWREGWHVGGGENGAPVKMRPVEVDGSYPKWMQDPANVPADWLRPR